ncbi:DUF551 domain-containing protein [Tateyamaria sp.]|uniref:DUF551 domain-containing protein n=1 Tax=Tateyamaria sp. TaxID=1929288 RepID=UPI003B2251AE
MLDILDIVEPSDPDLAQCPESVQRYIAELQEALDQEISDSGEIALIAQMQGFHKGRDAARQWKPMETAPRDGTEILGYVGEGYVGGAVVLRFDLNTTSWLDWDDDAWEATHWMPLPSPPEAWS